MHPATLIAIAAGLLLATCGNSRAEGVRLEPARPSAGFSLQLDSPSDARPITRQAAPVLRYRAARPMRTILLVPHRVQVCVVTGYFHGQALTACTTY